MKNLMMVLILSAYGSPDSMAVDDPISFKTFLEDAKDFEHRLEDTDDCKFKIIESSKNRVDFVLIDQKGTLTWSVRQYAKIFFTDRFKGGPYHRTYRIKGVGEIIFYYYSDGAEGTVEVTFKSRNEVASCSYRSGF